MFGKRHPEGNCHRNADKTRYRRETGLLAGVGAAVVVVATGVTCLGDDVGRALFKAGDDVGAALSHHEDDVGVAAMSTTDDVAAQAVRHGDEAITLPEISGRVAEEVATRVGIETVRYAAGEDRKERWYGNPV